MTGDDEETEILEGRLLGADLSNFVPRIFVTDPDDIEEGRTFIWTPFDWFERIEADNGAVEFSPLSMDEPDLDEWLREQGLEKTELDDRFARDVREEFLNEPTYYPEAPELSNQE
ncbi:MAG TPA: hypothetical protein VMT90_08355 [Dehalococcoidia bacterium]|jgi:hypothetical protein|nr:hypothetical protein [Dehalococcoidia bacterium]